MPKPPNKFSAGQKLWQGNDHIDQGKGFFTLPGCSSTTYNFPSLTPTPLMTHELLFLTDSYSRQHFLILRPLKIFRDILTKNYYFCESALLNLGLNAVEMFTKCATATGLIHKYKILGEHSH